jgi:hypothetical protein
MCECERDLALQVLPHQVSCGTQYGTHLTYPISGFAKSICRLCRGEREEEHPRAAIYGQKGKVERYYWREIYKTYLEIVRSFLAEQEITVEDIIEFERKFPKTAKDMKKEARKIWQVHRKNEPMYDLQEPTEASFLKEVHVLQKYLDFKYVQILRKNQKIGKWVGKTGVLLSAENVVTEWYNGLGFSVKKCERKLITVLVGTFCNSVITDPSDPRRVWNFSKDRKNIVPAILNSLIPADFGSKEYFKRRSEGFYSLFENLEKADMRELFEKLLEPSRSFRRYLGAYDNETLELGRTALRVMPQPLVLKCIDWAIREFWHRQSGWADFFVFNENEFKFVEVKSPHDELSLEQMNWFKWAIEEASIPCEIIRLTRIEVSRNP